MDAHVLYSKGLVLGRHNIIAFWRLQAQKVPFPGAKKKPLNKPAQGR
jgi:hypothetical protein